MTTFFQLVVSGLTIGAIYALVAIGFTLIYRASDIFNFAQGEFFMLGGMVAGILVLNWDLGFALASVIAVASTIACGVLLYVMAIKPAKSAGPVQLLIITIGWSIFVRGVVSATLGKDFVTYPPFFDPRVFEISGVVIQTQALVIIIGMLVLSAALWLFLTRTMIGKSVTAVAANVIAAQLVGINPGFVVGMSFALSAAIGAVGGLIATPVTLTSYDAGTMLAVKGFAAAMLGGMGGAAGPLVGGLLIGLLESFGAGYISSTYKDAFALIILLAVFAVRPQGLFGGNTVQRV